MRMKSRRLFVHVLLYVLTVGVNNLLDTRYFTRRASAYPGPGTIGADGRTLNAGITLKY